jgi:hypothetical protein
MEPVYQRIKRQKNLIVVLFVVLTITFLNLYFGYFKKEKVKTVPPEVFVPEKKIEIDFSVFRKSILKELQPVEKIPPPTQEEIGKENPFLPTE